MSLPALGTRPTATAAATPGAATPAAAAAPDAADNLFAALLAGLGDALAAAPVNGATGGPATPTPDAQAPAGDQAPAALPGAGAADPLAGMALLMAQYAPVAAAPGGPAAAGTGAAVGAAGHPGATDAPLPGAAGAASAGTGAAVAAAAGADLSGAVASTQRTGPAEPSTPSGLPAGMQAFSDASALPAQADPPALAAQAHPPALPDAATALPVPQALPDMGALAAGWAAAPAPVGAQAPAAAGPLYQAELPSRPGDAAFAGDLAAQVTVMVEGGLQQAQLRLNPSELGPIQIQLSVSAQNQTADISFTAVHGLTRESIEQALPELRDMLQAQGLSLGETGVSGGQQQGADGRGSAPQPAHPARPGSRNAGDVTPAAVDLAGLAGPGRATRGMLDLYA